MSDSDYLSRLRRDFGEKALELFRDPAISEIYLNADGVLRYYHHARGRQATDTKIKASALRLLANAIADHHGESLGNGRPDLKSELPVEEPFLGARVQFQFPPIVPEMAFSIRKPPAKGPKPWRYFVSEENPTMVVVRP